MTFRAALVPTALVSALAVALLPGAPAFTAAPHAAGEPGAKGAKTVWTEANKTGFGTARARGSNVWFTLQRGRTSEVFYPNLSTPSVRNLELLVTDGSTFTDRESRDTRHRTTRPDPSSLAFTQVNTAKSGKYRITKRFVTDPRRDALVVHVRLQSLDGGHYQVYALHDPALGNSGGDDRARRVGHALVATDGGAGVATSLVARPAFDQTSNGLLGSSDGWTDLATDHRLDQGPAAVGPGNVVQTGRIKGVDGSRGHQRATLTLGFGGDAGEARRTARASARTGFATVARRYVNGWHRYLGSLKHVPESAGAVRRQYLASELVLAASEDKQTPGAFVASPSAPWVWGDEVDGLSSPSGAYHLVWSRDSYEFGTALWADGDHAAARRIVDFLFKKQQKSDGSFPQNSDTTGKEVWTELQLDETALPIVLAHLVGRHDAATYAHVKKAADFIAGFKDEDTGLEAPFSPQERWENQSGYSPNSIAAQIAGLVCAADLARRNGDDASATRWLALADSWRANLKHWTVTTNGPLSDKPYFLRLTKDGKPNTGTTYGIGDGGPSAIDQREVVDPSFLDLVRYGILPADDPDVLSTLPVIDDELKSDTPNGPFWHRFSQDGYGERRDGGQWDITDPDTFTTLGRGWPLLTGERGEYAVTAGQPAASYLKAMAAASGSSDMLAEQVWDGRAPTGSACCAAGEGTRSATPLVWSHAGLVRLAWTIQLGRPADRQAVVADRYAG